MSNDAEVRVTGKRSRSASAGAASALSLVFHIAFRSLRTPSVRPYHKPMSTKNLSIIGLQIHHRPIQSIPPIPIVRIHPPQSPASQATTKPYISTSPITMVAVNFLNLLPPEVVANIISHVRPRDYLCIKMVCKALSAHAPLTITSFHRKQNPLPTHDKVCHYIQELCATRDTGCEYPSHLRHEKISERTAITTILKQVEEDHMMGPPRYDPEYLLCTRCNRHRPRRTFIDSQRKPMPSGDLFKLDGTFENAAPSKRKCIPCRMRSTRWYKAKHYFRREFLLVDDQKKFVCFVCYKPHPMKDKHRGSWWKGLPAAEIAFMREWGGSLKWLKGFSVCSGCGRAADAGRCLDEEGLEQLRLGTWDYET